MRECVRERIWVNEWNKLWVGDWVWERVSERSFEWEYVCENERESGVFVRVWDGERNRKIVWMCVKERDYERMSERAIEWVNMRESERELERETGRECER